MSKKEEAQFEELEQDNSVEVNSDTDSTEESDKVAKLQTEVKELNDKLLRTVAELDNTRRRAKEEVEKSLKYGISKFAEDLIPIVENFFLAVDNAPQDKINADEDIKVFADGIALTQKEMIKMLEKHGIKRVYPLNEKFSHDLHQAVVQIPSDSDEGTVVQVIQSGYTIGDRLLRPALVGVAKAK